MKKTYHIPISCFIILNLLFLPGCITLSPQKTPAPPIPKVVEPEDLSGPLLILPPIPNEVKRYGSSRMWKYVVIHHSASLTGNAAEFDKTHRKRGWNRGLGYHFVIGNGKGSGDGNVEIGPRWKKQIDGAHAGVSEYNRYGIGICLVGNFENDIPTKKQMGSLISLINYFQSRYNIPFEKVILHRHVKKTACPGVKFPYYETLASIKNN